MNARVDEDGFVWVYCHACKSDLDAGHLVEVDYFQEKQDLEKKGHSYFCKNCGAFLGYCWELQRVKEYAGK